MDASRRWYSSFGQFICKFERRARYPLIQVAIENLIGIVGYTTSDFFMPYPSNPNW
ncbi:hypothetical protein GYMLUDRAFT_266526 [Collybiopsis luxurians FD-317 M1]|nr:hypothetical protein GYMLUDRAFT_266526 [Collybiopsis luxurians FD-317 M1]